MIFVIDNYDSFTYNLVQYLGMSGAEVVVHRNDQITLRAVVEHRPSGILLSPGPCRPESAGVCLDIIQNSLQGGFLASVPIFGVCLGHQAMGYVSGATISRSGKIIHGKTSSIAHDGLGLLKSMPSPFQAVRYNSLVIQQGTINEDWLVSATSQEYGEIMGIRHKNLPLEGVQFHPESVRTQEGFTLVKNFVKSL